MPFGVVGAFRVTCAFRRQPGTDSRRAEVIALFLSEVLIMHVLGFHKFKTGRNFRLSFSKKADMSFI